MKMEITVDVNDYISDGDIREIAEQELRRAFREQLSNEMDVERVMANLSHHYIFEILADEWDGDLEEYLKGRIKEAITDNDSVRFELFRSAGYTTEKEGPAMPILREECEKCRPLFREAIEKSMDDYEIAKMSRDEVCYTISEVIADRLFGDKAED